MHRKCIAEASEVGPVKQVCQAVLTQAEQQRLWIARQRQGQRRDPTKIEIAVVELFPIGWGEKRMGVDDMRQIGPDTEHALAVLPIARACGIAGGKIERPVGLAESGRCPDPALACTRYPGAEEPRRVDTNSDDRAMIIAAVAEMSAERDEDPAIHQCKRAALTLSGRGETDAAHREFSGYIDWKAGQHAAVRKPQTKDQVPRRSTVVDHRIEVDRAAQSIDHWRSRDAERVYVAAGQRRTRNRMAEVGAPHSAPGCRVQRVDKIVFGRCYDQSAFRA